MNKVLVICEHNSARSQMFEEYLRAFGRGEFRVESAGLEPTRINPLVVEVMKEDGFDLSEKGTQSVFDLFRTGQLFDYVITVCDEAASSKCPVFPGITHRIHMPFPDPSALTGSDEEKKAETRRIRDGIKQAVLDFLENQSKFGIKA